jgi:hypothetical protein
MPINLDEDAGNERAERIPDGVHVAKVVRIFTRSNEGGVLKTKNKDRKIKVVLGDALGRECWYEAMVEGKAVFKIARLLKHVGYSSEALDADGIGEYTDFLDQQTAERFLLNRRVRIEVSTYTGDDGKQYAQVETLPQEDAKGKPQTGAAKAAPVRAAVQEQDDIPF